ncbi:MAG: M28 family metallopeptidase [Gemmatimonadota bacterium]|nr:M28 family peptidase [Gemmatimonadota bacterium]
MPRSRSRRVPRVPAALVVLTACAPADDGPTSDVALDSPAVDAALAAVRPAAVEGHIRALAADSLLGRAPGTPGYEGASRYVETQLRDLGLAPAGEDGGFRQAVTLRESLVDASASRMTLEREGRSLPLEYGTDYYLSPDPNREDATVTAPVVFAGYGVSAPGFGYDDYEGLDVEGRIVAVLSGAPPSLPSNPRAYYSSGGVKRDEAAARGAVGLISFNAPDDPRFRWDVSVARAQRGGFAWTRGEETSAGESPIQGSATLNSGAVEVLFAGSPVPLDSVLARASASVPQRMELPVTATLTTRTRHRSVESHNLVARLEGSDPDLRDEHVVYVAHIDHFGVGVAVDGDSIYNGAHDNASGSAIVLEIARAFTALPAAPRRSVVFLFVTAEEWGLLGSDYWVRHPTVPQESIVANFSLDMPFLFHPLRDIVPYGADHSTLDDDVRAAAARMGLAIGPDPIPEQVLFIRSDHFSFIRQGIPALFIKSGFETGDERDGSAINAAWRRDVYHTPRDEADQGFDFAAGVSHAQVNFLTGYHVAMRRARPTWKAGDFFGRIFGTPPAS